MTNTAPGQNYETRYLMRYSLKYGGPDGIMRRVPAPRPTGHPLKTRMIKIVPDDFVEPFEPRLSSYIGYIARCGFGDQMD